MDREEIKQSRSMGDVVALYDCIQIEQVSFAARSTRRRQHLSRYIRTAFTVLAVEHQEISLSLLSVWRAYPLRMPSCC